MKNSDYGNLTYSAMFANSVKPKLDPKVPPDHPYFEPPKKGGNRKVKNPNGSGRGWLSRDGGVWMPTPRMHGGEGWTIQYPDGRHHWHAYPDGATREKDMSYYDEMGSNFQFDYTYQYKPKSIFDNLMYDMYLPSEFEDSFEFNYNTPSYYIIPYEFGLGEALLFP